MDGARFLVPSSFQSTIRAWLQEDIPSFDYSGFVVGSENEVAILYGKAEGVLAGVPFVDMVFREVGCTIEWLLAEGTHFVPRGGGRAGAVHVARVTGPANAILMGERVALNILCRSCGIALRARRAREIAGRKGWKGRVAATRKTTPGFRLVEKYAVLVGGCDGHRMDLSSMVMLKDNAIVSCGSITNAVAKARSAAGFSLKIEVECQNLDDAVEAIKAGADVVMLDNMPPAALDAAARDLRTIVQPSLDTPTNFLIEASGGITLETLGEYMSDWVDVISLGSLTQGVPHVDLSLKIQASE